MKALHHILILSLALAVLPSAAAAQAVPSQSQMANLLARLDLTTKQKQTIRGILVKAEQESIRNRAEIEIAGLDLRAELEKDAPDAKKVGSLISQVSAREGEVRKARVLAWIEIRKQLSETQRRGLKASQGQSIALMDAKSVHGGQFPAGKCIDCHTSDRFDSAPPRSTLAPAPVLAPTPFDPPREACDEVTCLVDPDKACCKRLNALRERITDRKGATGELAIAASTPSLIYLDGKKLGTTPLRKRVEPGKHRLRVVPINGREATNRTIHVKPGSQVKLKLKL